MKISAGVAVWMCGVFALFCLAYALTGFAALDTLVDETEREASRGYAWFWMFLSFVGIVFGVLSWMISKGKLGNSE